MRIQPTVVVAIAALAVVGFVVLAVNVGWNLGVMPICEEAREHSAVSPDGKNVVILGTASCGRDRYHLTARLIGSSDATPLFSGYATSQDYTIDARWDSASDLKILYAGSVDVQYPSSGLDSAVLNDLGAVHVRYLQH